MKILVTGGAGFVGSHVSEYYAKKGDEVIVLDNLSRGETLKTADRRESSINYNWNHLKNVENIELAKGDIRKEDEIIKAVEGVDAVIHAAAQVAVTSSVNDPRMDFEINALGTFNVLEAARKSENDPAVVYCSTNKVYGENVNQVPVKEEDTRYVFDGIDGVPETLSIDLCEHTPYGCSKLAGDLYVQDYAELYGLKTAVFRMSCIYGTRQFGNEDQGWVAHFVISTVMGKPLTIYGDGKQVRDILYVSDLVRACDIFIESNKKSGVYNIGGGPKNTISLLELLDLLEEETGKRSEITFSTWRPSDQKVYVSDITKAKKELGW
ncbi:MAG: NAD-dependent epimerase/dehydratase family protein, partial [Candidatus Hydrothermarchaeaceae archaeon]